MKRGKSRGVGPAGFGVIQEENRMKWLKTGGPLCLPEAVKL